MKCIPFHRGMMKGFLMEKVLGENAEAPVWMALVPVQPKLKNIAFAIAPVVIAVLMQKPALRQEIMMRVCHVSRIGFQATADFCQVMATKSAQGYQKARL
jgi:hypothetical protein